MIDQEYTWDKHLNIHTTGRDDLYADQYHHPYEPTPYCILERLANSGLIREDDVVLDYGCGKGRVSFFLSNQVNAKAIGIDYDTRMYQAALANLSTSSSTKNISFYCANAERFDVPQDVNRCYFFNPFSVETLQSVISRIIQSFYDAPREILLFFYYPVDEYISYLMTVNELDFYDEIECDDLFKRDVRERILIFQLSEFC